SSAAERLRDQATPAANETPSFGPEAVVNATPDTVAPSVLSTSVNADTLTILFDEALAGSAPDPSAFSVLAGGVAHTVTSVATNGSSVMLVFSPPVKSSDVVTVSYSI